MLAGGITQTAGEAIIIMSMTIHEQSVLETNRRRIFYSIVAEHQYWLLLSLKNYFEMDVCIHSSGQQFDN